MYMKSLSITYPGNVFPGNVLSGKVIVRETSVKLKLYIYKCPVLVVRTPLTESSVSVVKAFALVRSNQTDTLSAVAAFVIHTVVNF